MRDRQDPFLPVADADLSGNERRYLLEAFDSGWISGSGPFVDRFEAAIADYCGVEHAIACANGTVALHLALLACGVRPGDEVIVPSLTYVATANSVRYCGAEPVFADCEPDSWNISAATVEPLITPRTRAIVPVHLYGLPVDMGPLRTLAGSRGIKLVEDAAEALGASHDGQMAGSFGDVATLSFYANKIMTTGEGGMALTNDPEMAARMRLLRGQGMDPNRRYWFPVIGYNYRITNLQCAIGLAQFERIEQHLATRRSLDSAYRAALADIPGLSFQKADRGSSCWMANVLFPDEDARVNATARLYEKGIETRPVFPPVHRLPPYEDLQADCPISDHIAARGLSLPSGPHVTDEHVGRIAAILDQAG